MRKKLQGIKRLYLDSNILIYLVEGSEAVRQPVLSTFEQIDAFDIDLVSSEITLAECLYGVFRDQDMKLGEIYKQLFSEEHFIKQIAVSREILVDAASFGGQAHLKLIDALHFATAISVGADAFLTNDKAFHTTKQMRVLQLSEFSRN